MMKENEKAPTRSYEADLLVLTKKVLAEKKLLAKFILVFAVIGIIYALNQQKRFTSVVTMAPEVTGMGMSASLSDLAGMVGLDLGSGKGSVDAIYPEIYPEVLASSGFLVKLFNIEVKQKNDSTPKSYYRHLREDTFIPFWSYPSIWLHQFIENLTEGKGNLAGNVSEADPAHLTKEQEDVCKAIIANMGCQKDNNTNIVTISVEDVDPFVAATIADTIQNWLQDYIIQYRTKKARIDLEYALRLNKEAEQEYIKAQKEFASFADTHTNTILMSYQTKQTALENMMDLKYTNYRQTSLQVQQAIAKVQERTPAFTVIQCASVPLRSSSTPRSFMVIGFVFLGCLADAAWVLFLRQWVVSHKKNRQ